VKGLKVDLRGSLSAEGALLDVVVTINGSMAGEIPPDVSMNFLIFLDTDMDSGTGFAAVPFMLNGIGADWNLGFSIEGGEITFSILQRYINGSFKDAGNVSASLGRSWMAVEFSWVDIGSPGAVRFMTYVIKGEATDMIPNPGEEPPVITFEFPPVASIELPETVDEGSSFVLDGSASEGYGSEIVSYSWDLDGDGVDDLVSEEPVVAAMFEDDGVREVTLTVETAQGLTYNASTTVQVVNVPPSEVTIVREGSLMIGLESIFTGDASDPGSDELVFSWDFDDGTTLQGRRVSHSWDSVGGYRVELTVSDGDGGVGTAEMELTTEALPPLAERLSLDSLIAIGDPTKGEYKFEFSFSYDDWGTGWPADGELRFYVDGRTGDPIYQSEIAVEGESPTFETPVLSFEPGVHTGELVAEFEGGSVAFSESVEFRVERSGLDLLPVFLVLLLVVGVIVYYYLRRMRA
jgi:PKD repeat protein